MKAYIQIFMICIGVFASAQAQNVKGIVLDNADESPLPGVIVSIAGEKTQAMTDGKGAFSIQVSKFPATLKFDFLGYEQFVLTLNSASEGLKIKMSTGSQELEEVSIVARRLSEKQRESALTVEALDLAAIKETPAANFYDGLGNLKGVDLTSASIGFKIINTRGFNSTSPVRSLQVIDGVDNQSPGLNFSLGNFLGSSDLDVVNVDIIAGASSAFYGPNAFNGVISMTTKDPFDFQGISASVKVGERGLGEYAVRWADAFKNSKGEDVFAYKINLYYLHAYDWEADNYNPVTDADYGRDNPGRYDAVNIYGDEGLAANNDYDNPIDAADYISGKNIGLGKFYRNGYQEVDLVDYNTKNLKFNTALHYKMTKRTELIYAFNLGSGTTVYQGDNRYSLKDILFMQNRLEIREKDKWFIRAYSTNEDAGNSYDAYFTGLRILQELQTDQNWNTSYANNWAGWSDVLRGFSDFPNKDPNQSAEEWYQNQYLPFVNRHRDTIAAMHAANLDYTNSLGGYVAPGSDEFNQLFQQITSKELAKGGTKFYDKSALYHLQGAYSFEIPNGKWTVGGSGRLYMPQSNGNIFDEVTYENERIVGGLTLYDTIINPITNYEFGAFTGIEKSFMGEILKTQLTVRADKNQNFNTLFSIAASVIYNIDSKNTLRLSLSSAIRNPTLQDQYLRYRVGRATLLGNLSGYDSLVTVESFNEYRSTSDLDRSKLSYFNVDPIKPEKVKSIELGYRATLINRLYLDASYYYSFYNDFIGYIIGLDMYFAPGQNLPSRTAVYRVSANATSQVTTQGFSIGLNYYLDDRWSLNGNYSWNKLNSGEDDPIIPAFNTPENKFNIGVTGRKFNLWKNGKNRFGASVNYKWVQGFRFEGSPQFTGDIDSYGLVDAQMSYAYKDFTFKLGASNLLNNMVYQVYGGPRVGRMAYFSILFEPLSR